MVELLVEEFSIDITAVNIHGHNVLHIAAMAGHAVLLVYFITKKNMNIYEVDRKGRTALHLAALEGQAITLIILVSLYDNINIRDND